MRAGRPLDPRAPPVGARLEVGRSLSGPSLPLVIEPNVGGATLGAPAPNDVARTRSVIVLSG